MRNIWKIRYTEHDFDALNPELWAREGLVQLYENSVMLNRVNRQFDATVAEYGETVHAHRPGKYEISRTAYTADNTLQYATTEDVEVKLNQKLDVTFALRDTQRAFSFKDLVQMNLTPAIKAIAKGIDTALWCQVYQFMGNNKSIGKLGTATTQDNIVDLGTLMDNNLIPTGNRSVVVPPTMYGNISKIENFITAKDIGNSNALKTGDLGMLYGMDFVKSNNAAHIVADYVDTVAMAVTGAHAAGTTEIVLSANPTSNAPTGKWCTIAGDMQPHRITAYDSDSITISPGLKYAVESGAAVTIYKGVTVNLSAGYDAGEVGTIAHDGGTSSVSKIQHAQLVSDETYFYGAINDPTHHGSVLFDRPLDHALTNDDVLGYGPVGNYGFAFDSNAITFVSRPLPLPPARYVDSFIATMDNIGMRATITYDNKANLTIVKLDLLAGIKVLDARLGCIIYG